MSVPQDPLPISPRLDQLVETGDVDFRWAPVGEVESYRVQISKDDDFEEVVFEDVVPGRTGGLTAHSHIGGRGHRFFWRVIAERGEGRSPGTEIATFIIGTNGDDQTLPSPAEQEPLGPMPELFRTAGIQAWAEIASGRQPAPEESDGEVPITLEGAEVVSLGMTFIVAGLVLIGVILIIAFYAC